MTESNNGFFSGDTDEAPRVDTRGISVNGGAEIPPKQEHSSPTLKSGSPAKEDDNDIYDKKYGHLADRFEETSGRKAGGKRAKHKPTAAQRAQFKADKAALQEERAQQLQIDFASQLDYLRAQMREPNGEMIFRRFYQFLTSALHLRETVSLGKKDVKYKFTHSSGPGGQNVNKVATAVTATHLPTFIRVENRSTRQQVTNKQRAFYDLTAAVQEHIKTWRVVLQGVDESELEEAVRSLLK